MLRRSCTQATSRKDSQAYCTLSSSFEGLAWPADKIARVETTTTICLRPRGGGWECKVVWCGCAGWQSPAGAPLWPVHFHWLRLRYAPGILYIVRKITGVQLTTLLTFLPHAPVWSYVRMSLFFPGLSNAKDTFQIIWDILQWNVLFVIQVCRADRLLYAIRDLTSVRHWIHWYFGPARQWTVTETISLDSSSLWSQFPCNSHWGNSPWLGTPVLNTRRCCLGYNIKTLAIRVPLS